MIITIHQPEHMPWLGFFHKIYKSDLMVFLDVAQFRKNYFQNRNRVRTANGWSWITVPVHHKSHTLINDVSIVSDRRWKKKWWDTIYYSYIKADHFHGYSDQLYVVINQDWESLSDLNISLIKTISSFLGIELNYVKASDLGIVSKGNELLLSICQKLDAKIYLSGVSGKDYLDEQAFAKENIKVIYQKFHHPIYSQLFDPFEPCMSTIDLIFNHGAKSLDMIMGNDVPVMEKIFL